MNKTEIVILVYFAIGFLFMAGPVFHPVHSKKFDDMDRGSFMFGCMIILIAWPIMVWVAMREAVKSARRDL